MAKVLIGLVKLCLVSVFALAIGWGVVHNQSSAYAETILAQRAESSVWKSHLVQEDEQPEATRHASESRGLRIDPTVTQRVRTVLAVDKTGTSESNQRIEFIQRFRLWIELLESAAANQSMAMPAERLFSAIGADATRALAQRYWYGGNGAPQLPNVAEALYAVLQESPPAAPTKIAPIQNISGVADPALTQATYREIEALRAIYAQNAFGNNSI